MLKNINVYVIAITYFLLLITGKSGYAAETVVVPMDSNRWEFSDPDQTHRKIGEYLGQSALTMIIEGDQLATLKDVDLTNGIIEMDVIFSRGDEIDGYVELRWHLQKGQEEKQFDKLYLRPNKSSFSDSVQYAPIINGFANWQMYYLPDNTKAVTFPFDQWFHVKIVTVNKYAEVYVVDMDKPILTVNLVGNSSSGKIALEILDAHVANFSYTIDDNPPVKGTPPIVKAEPTAIKSWLISDAFEEKTLEGKSQVTEKDRKDLTWVNLDSEADGKGNIAKVLDHDSIIAEVVRNSVFARATIISDKDQTKLMKFGFSDRVKLYFNGRVLYQENQSYHSRNAWFMGNMGYFNEIYLPLKKGNNELWMGISEGPRIFAGWGVQAMFENLDGITFDNAQQMNLDGATGGPSGDNCMASYALENGKVHIPCISVPDGSGGTLVYEADLLQLPLAPSIYTLDENSIKRH